MERVKFFSQYDMSIGLFLDRLEQVYDSYEVGRVYDGLIDVVELWQCKKIIECVSRKNWDKSSQQRYNEMAKAVPSSVARYFKTANNSDFLLEFNKLDYNYKQAVFEVFENVAKDFLSEDLLDDILENDPDLIHMVLSGANTVRKFSTLLTNHLKTHPNIAAELLLNQYSQSDNLNNRVEKFFPRQFSLDDREQCIIDYLNDIDSNYNYIKLALELKDSIDLKLRPETKLLAKRVLQRREVDFFEEGKSFFPIEIRVVLNREDSVSEIPIETKYENSEESSIITTYISKKYLEGCSYSALLYNFLTFFDWFSSQGYLSLVSNPNNIDPIELSFVRGKSTYFLDTTKAVMNKLAIAQVSMYNKALLEDGDSLELVFKEFYEKYFNRQYNYPAPSIILPPNKADFVTKIRTLVPEMEAIVKHYDTFVQNHEIDLELLSISKPLKLTEGRSQLEKRNIYMKKDEHHEIQVICNLLFSSQSMLWYIDPYKNDEHRSLFDLIVHKTINYSMYEEWQKDRLHYLIEKSVLIIDDTGGLHLMDENQMFIFHSLWHNQVLSYWSCPLSVRIEIDRLLEKGWLEYDDFLLSRQERDWFSYYLDNSKFTNGLAIRNKFMHGVNVTEDGNELAITYNTILMLYIVLLCKIDIDFKLAEIAEFSSNHV